MHDECLSLETHHDRRLKSLYPSIYIYISISLAPPFARLPQLGQCPPKGLEQGIAVPLCVCEYVCVCVNVCVVCVCVCIYTVQEEDL